MGSQPLTKPVSILLCFGFVFVLIGFALIISFTQDSKQVDFLSGITKQSLQYHACYFPFIWGSALVTAMFQRPSLMAITSGLLAAILVFTFSLGNLDNVRILLDNADEPVFKALGLDKTEFQKLAAGVILAYFGSGLAFIASVLVFRSKNSNEQAIPYRLPIGIVVVLSAFIGCILVWSSSDVSFTPPTKIAPHRAQLFEATASTVAVVIIFLVGMQFRISPLVYIAAALSAFYNLDILDTFLDIDTGALTSRNQTMAGCIFLWLSALAIVFYCAIVKTQTYLPVESYA